jgi:chromosomal replication initiator protein
MNDTRKKIPVSVTPHRMTGASKQFHGLNPRWTFNNFVVGPGNLMAFNAAQLVAGTQGYPYSPLVIHSDVGLGKTHLMNAIGIHLLGTPAIKVCRISLEAFTNDYIVALQSRELVKFRDRYRNPDVLLFDSIQFLAGKERMQEEFLHTFNAVHDAGKLIVITADQPPGKIAGLTVALVSRFEAGLYVEITPPDRETCLTILRRKADELQASIPDECLEHISTVAGQNVRRLEGALHRAISYRMISGKDLTLSALQRLLKDLGK